MPSTAAPNRDGRRTAAAGQPLGEREGSRQPGRGLKANRKDELESRLERCLRQRGRMPNIVAVDFARATSWRRSTR